MCIQVQSSYLGVLWLNLCWQDEYTSHQAPLCCGSEKKTTIIYSVFESWTVKAEVLKVDQTKPRWKCKRNKARSWWEKNPTMSKNSSLSSSVLEACEYLREVSHTQCVVCSNRTLVCSPAQGGSLCRWEHRDHTLVWAHLREMVLFCFQVISSE